LNSDETLSRRRARLDESILIDWRLTTRHAKPGLREREHAREVANEIAARQRRAIESVIRHSE
jgi:hypothetical protein